MDGKKQEAGMIERGTAGAWKLPRPQKQQKKKTGAGTKMKADDETGSTDGTGVETAVTNATGDGTEVTGTVEHIHEAGAEMADTDKDEVEAVNGADTEVETREPTDMETGALLVDETGTGTGVLELEGPQGCEQFRAT